VVLVFILSITPWLVRDYVTFGRFIPIRDNFGTNLYWATGAGTLQLSGDWPVSNPNDNRLEALKVRQMGEVAYIAEKQHQALGFIRAHPGSFIWRTINRVVWFWTGDWKLLLKVSERHWDILLVPLFASYTLLSALAFLGLRLAIPKRIPEVWLLAGLLFFYPLVYYITYFDVRYRHPIEPEMMLLGAYAVVTCASRVRKTWHGRIPKHRMVVSQVG
jgi:hypothetical protein